MKISTRLKLNTVFSFMVITLIALSLFFTTFKLTAVREKGDTTVLLVKGIADLEVLTYDYLLYGEIRAKKQWELKCASLESILISSKFHSPDELTLLQVIRENLDNIKILFKQLTASTGTGDRNDIISRELKERQVSRILLEAREMSSNAFRLDHIIHLELEHTERVEYVVVLVLSLILFLGVAMLSLMVNNAIGKPMTELREGTEIIGSGNLDYKVGTDRDDEIGQLSRDFDNMTDNLKSADRMKSMFIASMSHELRTPLNSIIGFTSMTLEGMSGELNKEQKDNLARVFKSGHHLLDLVTDVIDISKIEAGKAEVLPQVFSLVELLNQGADSIQGELKDKGLAFRIEADPVIKINTDRKKLLQCLINLLSNAVKFTEKGGITVLCTEIGNDLEISVTDTGIGIPTSDLEKIFQPFERLDSHMKVIAGGTGLGLYLTKKIATDVLHGNISVESKEGIGSTFKIVIPKTLKP